MTSASRPATQALVGQPELGAPVDGQIGMQRDEVGAGQAAVEHDEDVAEVGGVLLQQPAAGGHVHRLADLVEHDLVRGREELQAADARHDPEVDVQVRGRPATAATRIVES